MDTWKVWMRGNDGSEDIQSFDKKSEAINHVYSSNRIFRWGGAKVAGNLAKGWVVTLPDKTEITIDIILD